MKYIDVEEIVNEVRNSLGSYFASNKVDESILPRVIRRCIGQMGLKILPEKSTVIELCNYEAELPEGLNRICLAMLCSGGGNHSGGNTTYVPDIRVSETEQRVVTELNLCESKWDVCTDECGNMTKLIQKTTWDAFSHSSFAIMRPSKSAASWCYTGCPNLRSNSKYGFEIKEKNGKKLFQSTEASGFVYIEYLSELEHEEGFEIPDHHSVRSWIYQEMVKECFRYMWHNGEEVYQKFKDAEREVVIWEERARQIYQRSEVREYYSMAKRLAKRFNAFERWVSPTNSVYSPRTSIFPTT